MIKTLCYVFIISYLIVLTIKHVLLVNKYFKMKYEIILPYVCAIEVYIVHENQINKKQKKDALYTTKMIKKIFEEDKL